jgi:ribonuclease P protein component
VPANRVGRIRRSTDFVAVLALPPAAMSPHFAVHRRLSSAEPSSASGDSARGELSTAWKQVPHKLVDKTPHRSPFADACVGRPELGIVVPKRYARRSVTRSLLKRQIRESVERCHHRLPSGLWVIRLRAAFAEPTYPSAASEKLQAIVRSELALLLDAAARRSSADTER